MELKIEISARNLAFDFHKVSGEGLNKLIAESAKHKISSIVLSGETQSYTFLRQVALFCNLNAKLNKCEIILKSPNYKIVDGSIMPIYE